MTAAYLETGLAHTTRLGWLATTALRTAMVWRAAWNVKEAAEAKLRRNITVNGQEFYPTADPNVFRSFDGVTSIHLKSGSTIHLIPGPSDAKPYIGKSVPETMGEQAEILRHVEEKIRRFTDHPVTQGESDAPV